MNYCNNCGAEITDKKAKNCPNCNKEYINYEKTANEGLIFAILGIFLWMIPLFGFISSICGIKNCSKIIKEQRYKTKATIGLIISIICFMLTTINWISQFI